MSECKLINKIAYPGVFVNPNQIHSQVVFNPDIQDRCQMPDAPLVYNFVKSNVNCKVEQDQLENFKKKKKNLRIISNGTNPMLIK